MADVTVVIPTKDRAALLREALRSLREQTVPVDVIVADDGSSDGTAEVVRAYGALLLSNPVGGWGAAGGRNAGLGEVRTERVGFLDSDDLLLPRAVEQLGAALDRAPDAPFAYGRALTARRDAGAWTAEGLIASRRRELATLPSSLFARNSVPSSGALVRTAAAREVGGFDASVPFNEDFYFWVDLALLGIPAHVPEIVSVYRVHVANRFIASAGLDYERAAALGRDHPELAGDLARHFGARLCEHASDAVHRRDVRSLAGGIRSILRLSPEPVRTLTAAVEHQRTRHAMTARGREAWSRLPDLRAWLATYDGDEPIESAGGLGVPASM